VIDIPSFHAITSVDLTAEQSNLSLSACCRRRRRRFTARGLQKINTFVCRTSARELAAAGTVTEADKTSLRFVLMSRFLQLQNSVHSVML